MIHTFPRPRFAVATALALLAGLPGRSVSQAAAPAAGFTAGTRALFDLNLGATPVGEIPTNIDVRNGTLDVVMKDNVKMLKASSVSEFLISLPEFLPETFTLEFEIVPKGCCNPEDLAFEGTRSINQGTESARIQWDSDGNLAVVGGGEMYQSPMPADLSATLPGVLTQVAVSFDGGTIKLYTNGRRLYTLTDRKFVRGRVLRVQLGGQDDGKQAVHLAKLRVATNEPPWTGFAASGFVPGAKTLYASNFPAESLGTFPKTLRALKGRMAIVAKEGTRMLKASDVSEFLVPLALPLPQNFTLEFELIPKECCNPQDLSFEGTPTVSQGDASAHILWKVAALQIYGGGPSYDSPMPDALALVVAGSPTLVQVSIEGTTVKLYTNGRRLYTLTDRQFARGKQLRVFLGGQDGRRQSVHLARLRIATN